jgi:TetR/AcrR family transcriptional repressor of nem operon
MPRAKSFNEEDVLYKAMSLFWKKGYHATSMQDLVTYLGINRASLYDTFGGKKNLFDKSLELYCFSNKDATLQFLKDQVSVKDGIRKLFEISIIKATSDTDKKGCFVVNSTTEMIPKDADVKAIVSNNKDNFESIFYNFLLTGQESGEISKDKDLIVIATLIYTLFSGISVIAKVEPKQKDLLSTVDLVLSLLD